MFHPQLVRVKKEKKFTIYVQNRKDFIFVHVNNKKTVRNIKNKVIIYTINQKVIKW